MRRSLALGAFAAGALLLAPGANAQTYQVGQYLGNMNDLNRFTYNTMGSAAQHANYSAGGANWTTLAGQNAARMTGQATATIGGRTVVLTAVSRVPLPAIVNAARGVALMNPATAAVTLLGFAAMQGWLSPSGLRWNEDPQTNLTHPFVKDQETECDATSGLCTQWRVPTAGGGEQWLNTRQAACNAYRSYVSSQYPAYTVQLMSCFSPADPWVRTRVYPPSDPSSYFTQNLGEVTRQAPGTTQLIPYTWEAAEPLLSDAATHNYDAVDWKTITQELLRRGGSVDPAQITTTVSGPASQPGEKTTTTGKNAAGEPTTTTKQTTHNYTYNNNNVTHNTTTTTTTVNNITNNIENETTEQTDNETPPESATDTPLPSVPDFYEQKYPEGFAGVWATHKAAYQTTSLGTFAAKLMPSGLGAGQCPQFSINLDLQWLQGGTHDVSVPCFVWDAAKVVIIISALLLARRLIFGG